MADDNVLRTRPATDAGLRALGWIGLTLVLFVAVQVASLYVTSLATNAIGIGFPEREHFAFAEALLGGLLMLIVVPAAGRMLGYRVRWWAGVVFAIPMVLAAVANFVIFEDVRSGLFFETDHALPEIFIPPALVLLALAQIGRRMAGDGTAQRAWAWLALAAAVVVAVLTVMTGVKMTTTGGDFALDSPLTVVILAAVGAYALIAVKAR